MKQQLKAVVASLAVLAAGAMLATTAHAAAIAADGSWNAFDVDPLSANSGGFEWIALDGSAQSFDLDLSGPATLKVIDAGFAGDRFEIFDKGVSLGLSSAASNGYPASVGLGFDAAWADAAYSRGSFTLGAGSHSITGLLFSSALDGSGNRLDATVGAVSVSPLATPVPEPTSVALMLGGLALVAWRRRSR